MKKDIVKRTLKNGIKVYLYRDRHLKRMIASYNVKYGSCGYYNKFYYQDKPYDLPQGMAHFLEHMLIEESKYGNMLMHFKSLNYETNGATHPELTSYYFIGIKDTKESLKELIHMIDDPVFTSESVEKVKSAIISEVTKNDDQKYRIAYNANKRNAYANFEVVGEDYNPLGTKKTTNSITYEDAKVAYDAYYNDENKFLVIGGNFDIDEMIEYLESIYSELKPHKNEMRPFDYEEKFEVRKPYEEIIRDVDNNHLLVTYKIKNDFEEDNLLQDLYLFIYFKMKFGPESEFVTDLIKKKIILGGIATHTDFFLDTITLTFYTDVLDKEEFLKALESELNTDGLDEYTFELIKKTLIVNDLAKLDYIYGSLQRFPTEVDFTEKLFNLDCINRCSLEGLKAYINDLSFDVKTVTLLKSKKAD